MGHWRNHASSLFLSVGQGQGFSGLEYINATALLLGRMPTYSFGEDHLIVKYSERMVAQYLLEVSLQAYVYLHLSLSCPIMAGLDKRAESDWGTCLQSRA